VKIPFILTKKPLIIVKKVDMMLKLARDYLITLILIGIIVSLSTLAYFQIDHFTITEPQNVQFTKENTINFSSLTLEQKIAQMIIVYAQEDQSIVFNNMMIGGIFLGAEKSKDDFVKLIDVYQNNALIPLFVAADLEGCRNPFENFKSFSKLTEIETSSQAKNLATEQGILMNELGFNINFAPVVDLDDQVWNCRNFLGTPSEVAEKANAYVNGLKEQNILAIAKHYPGKTLLEDVHNKLVKKTIEEDDLVPFQDLINNNVPGIMVSHTIVDGTVNSEGKPVSVSKLPTELSKKYSGLIVTDEIGMSGLKEFYTSEDGFVDYRSMFIDLFNTGNDLILTFDRSPRMIYENMILTVAEAVRTGEISAEKIDNSVKKILRNKGLEIIN